MKWQVGELIRAGIVPIVSIQHEEVYVHDPPASLVYDLRSLAAAGAAFVSGVFMPVPKSSMARGKPCTGPEPTMSLVVIAWPAGSVKSAPPAVTAHWAGSLLVRSNRQP